MNTPIRFVGIVLAFLQLLAPLPALAWQVGDARPRSTVDLTRVERLYGKPAGGDQCPLGQVLSGDTCLSLQAATGGATILPYDVPAGTYRNLAPYPLSFTFNPSGHRCYGSEIYVDGRYVARMHSDCEGTFTSVQTVVPSGSTVSWGAPGQISAVVTAFANNASWQDTGIRFALTGSGWSQIPGTYDGIRTVYDQYGAFLGTETSPGMFPPYDGCPSWGCGGFD